MTAITAFPTATNRILVHGDNQYTFTAAETLKAGQVVQVKPSGGNFKIYAAALANSSVPIGIVDQNATSGDTDVTVNLYGCVCYGANADDTTAIEAGSALKVTTDTSCDGVLEAWAGGALEYMVGIAMTDIAANGWGKVLICPHESAIA
jgi:hypothetical protein